MPPARPQWPAAPRSREWQGPPTPQGRAANADRASFPSMRTEFLEWPGYDAQNTEHHDRERKARNRQAGGEGKVEARKPQLIDQVGDHVDLASADELRRGKCAERPGKRGAHSGHDAWRGQRQ